MQLTQFTDYSLRALIFIAIKKQSCTINEISTAYGLSENHVVKIIHNLAKLGLINTTRGKNGGITMAVDPADINIKAAVLKLESHFDLVPCFNKEKQNCIIAPVCILKHVLHDARKAFFDVLEKYTLADMIKNQTELKPLLQI
ncbi:MAG: Rrf2 family transcriptional regulator [Gammaproteobacteria bacterium]|nr:Rrf2 family transcriptional regulator [Gammaproteobacteria bacterium]